MVSVLVTAVARSGLLFEINLNRIGIGELRSGERLRIRWNLYCGDRFVVVAQTALSLARMRDIPYARTDNLSVNTGRPYRKAEQESSPLGSMPLRAATFIGKEARNLLSVIAILESVPSQRLWLAIFGAGSKVKSIFSR